MEKYLLLDNSIIESIKNVHMKLGKVIKNDSNPLFKEEHLWECRFDNMGITCIYDEEDKLFKCWYSTFIYDPATNIVPNFERPYKEYFVNTKELKRQSGLCYAISEDGINWHKPTLGIIEFEGNKKNNLVSREIDLPGIYKEKNGNDLERKYKLFGKSSHDWDAKMCVSFSNDGLHWSGKHLCPQIEAAGDTNNNVFWSSELNKYIGITRLWSIDPVNTTFNDIPEKDWIWKKPHRIVARTDSFDFLTWSKAENILEGLDWEHQTYAMSVFKYANVYLGFVMIFNPMTDRVHCELAWSKDSLNWQRICPGTDFIGNADEVGGYDWGCLYASSPIIKEDKILIYYYGDMGKHTSWREGSFNQASLGKDEFAGYEPISPNIIGTIITRTLKFENNSIMITADIKGNGYIIVKILDDNYKELYTYKKIKNSDKNKLSYQIKVNNSILNKIKINFEMYNSKLYSFTFC